MAFVPKILILDNDETTGCYYILFVIYDFLRLSNIGEQISYSKTLQILIEYFEKYNVFRPGLRHFLEGASYLKKNKKIDKICIYTNQLDFRDVGDLLWKSRSVPEIIADMFSRISNNNALIDNIFTRPIGDNVVKIENYPVKDLSRVYQNLYPNIPVNFSSTLFIDDLHDPKYIIDSSNSNTDSKSRYKISSYSKHQPVSLFVDIISAILEKNGNIRLGQKDTVLLNQVDNKWQDLNSDIKTKNKNSKLTTVFRRVKKFFEKKDIKQTNPIKNKTKKHVKSPKNKRRTIKRGASHS
jgi:hypothetical protein